MFSSILLLFSFFRIPFSQCNIIDVGKGNKQLYRKVGSVLTIIMHIYNCQFDTLHYLIGLRNVMDRKRYVAQLKYHNKCIIIMKCIHVRQRTSIHSYHSTLASRFDCRFFFFFVPLQVTGSNLFIIYNNDKFNF